ncbi:MAG TPA: M23 family metallopeptidase [Candidatus Uhrbacteria bacterium]|nr:M23 family metallopeptidase [Candidatus Uhrbacteria bacterium]
MKEKIQKKIIIIIIVFLLSPFSLFAQEPCETKYPDDGKCKTECEAGEHHDDTSGLCSSGKCCHMYAPVVDLSLQVPIFSYTKAADIAEYIVKIYEYALIVLAPLAIVVIIWAGFLWLLAGGDVPKISNAKKYISGAVTGLIIAFLSYIILSFFGLTSLKSPGIEYIEGEGDHHLIPFVPQQEYEKAGSDVKSIGGECFPVVKDSFDRISWNYGSARSGGTRCHAGVDIYTKGLGEVVAIADGIVTLVGTFYPCSKGMSMKVLIQHGNYTVNYGEINQGTIDSRIKVGATVKAGQYIGRATNCGMLHFELYEGKSRNYQWYPPPGVRITKPNQCLKEGYPKTYVKNCTSNCPVSTNIDPSATIKSLLNKMCAKN